MRDNETFADRNSNFLSTPKNSKVHQTTSIENFNTSEASSEQLDSLKSGESIFKEYNFCTSKYNKDTGKCVAFWKTLMQQKDIKPINCRVLMHNANEDTSEGNGTLKEHCSKEGDETWYDVLVKLLKLKMDEMALAANSRRCKLCHDPAPILKARKKGRTFAKSDLEDYEDTVCLNNWKPISKDAIKKSTDASLKLQKRKSGTDLNKQNQNKDWEEPKEEYIENQLVQNTRRLLCICDEIVYDEHVQGESTSQVTKNTSQSSEDDAEYEIYCSLIDCICDDEEREENQKDCVCYENEDEPCDCKEWSSQEQVASKEIVHLSEFVSDQVRGTNGNVCTEDENALCVCDKSSQKRVTEANQVEDFCCGCRKDNMTIQSICDELALPKHPHNEESSDVKENLDDKECCICKKGTCRCEELLEEEASLFLEEVQDQLRNIRKDKACGPSLQEINTIEITSDVSNCKCPSYYSNASEESNRELSITSRQIENKKEPEDIVLKSSKSPQTNFTANKQNKRLTAKCTKQIIPPKSVTSDSNSSTISKCNTNILSQPSYKPMQWYCSSIFHQ